MKDEKLNNTTHFLDTLISLFIFFTKQVVYLNLDVVCHGGS